MQMVDFLFRWLHLIFGVVWIGLLYYFNFVQGEYFKQASSEALADVKQKLVPRALAWFRWASVLTFASGLLLFGGLVHAHLFNDFIILGAVIGFLMFLNVWLIIWPQQKIVLGLVSGDAAAAAAKAALASRTNTLFSMPVLFCMLGSPHLGYQSGHLLAAQGGGLGLYLALLLVVLLEFNAWFGKLGPLASIRGVIHMSLALAAALYCLVLFL